MNVRGPETVLPCGSSSGPPVRGQCPGPPCGPPHHLHHPRPTPCMRRLDHAVILLVIVGTYTPVGVLVLHGTLATVVLAVV